MSTGKDHLVSRGWLNIIKTSMDTDKLCCTGAANMAPHPHPTQIRHRFVPDMFTTCVRHGQSVPDSWSTFKAKSGAVNWRWVRDGFGELGFF